MHDSARADLERLLATLADELHSVWSVGAKAGILTSAAPRFEV